MKNPSLIPTIALIAVMGVAARMGGIGRAMRFATRLGGERPIETDSARADDLTSATVQAVVMAAAFYPRRALCLEQSLALYVLLRRRGIDAALKLGVQTIPFSAHAWVEVNGVPVNEKQGHIEQLATFQQVGV
jgi:hypothetical protein